MSCMTDCCIATSIGESLNATGLSRAQRVAALIPHLARTSNHDVVANLHSYAGVAPARATAYAGSQSNNEKQMNDFGNGMHAVVMFNLFAQFWRKPEMPEGVSAYAGVLTCPVATSDLASPLFGAVHPRLHLWRASSRTG